MKRRRSNHTVPQPICVRFLYVDAAGELPHDRGCLILTGREKQAKEVRQDMTWLKSNNWQFGEKHGPYTTDEVLLQIHDRKLRPDWFGCRKGETDWRRLLTIEESWDAF